LSHEPTEKEADVALTTLCTHVKSKSKRQRHTPLYYKTRMSTRIKLGKPQTPTKTATIIYDSPKEQENIVSLEIKGEEGTSKQASAQSPITYVRRNVAKSKSIKKHKAHSSTF